MANGLCNKAFREGFFCVRSDCHAVLPLELCVLLRTQRTGWKPLPIIHKTDHWL